MKLTSSHRKFARGVEQIRTLSQEVREYEESDAYTFHHRPRKVEANMVEFDVFAHRNTPMPSDWPLRIGEAIQNLRAALDHFVYDASGGNDRSQFPICKTPAAFRTESKQRLAGIPEDVVASIERGQPYNWTPTHPDLDNLAILQRWSNADKHRELATVLSVVRMEAVGLPKGAESSWIQFGTGKELASAEMLVSTFLVMSKDVPIDASTIESWVRYRVEIEGRQVDTLVSIARHVYRVLADCESGVPLHPTAPYPI